MTGPVAVIDLGSGAAKLLIVDDGWLDGGPALARSTVKTRLLPVNGDRLTDDALAAAAGSFDRFAADLAHHKPVRLAVVGTAWARSVSNLDGLTALVADRFGPSYGAELDVIDGQREAELGYLGATRGRELTQPALVVDIGSGSTEFAFRSGSNGAQERLVSLSLPVGGRSVTADYLVSDPPRPEELSSALAVVELHLDDLRRELPAVSEVIDGGVVLGTGAVGKIAEVEIGLPDPDAESVDGYRMEKGAVEEVFRALATETHTERAFNPGLRPDDVEDVVGAMCVLVEFMRQFSIEEIIVSEWGVAAGLAAELLDQPQHQ
jgi:exopolyphosphatase/guanosine-5'-triphosphate,3'-diphosphate pyrophosphatase